MGRKDIELYKDLTKNVFKEYSHLYLCFRDIVDGEVDLLKLGLDKILADELKEAVLEKFKPQKVIVRGEIKLQSYHAEGLEKIRAILKEVQAVSKTMKIIYLGAGRYKFAIEDIDYKPIEDCLKKVQLILEKFNDNLSKSSFTREKSE